MCVPDFDDRALDARALAKVEVRAETPSAARCSPRARARQLAPDEGRPFDLVEVVELHALADPDVPRELDARDRELDLALERVVVGLPVLVEVADVLPVAVEDAAVERPSPSRAAAGKSSFAKSKGRSAGMWRESTRARSRRCRC